MGATDQNVHDEEKKTSETSTLDITMQVQKRTLVLCPISSSCACISLVSVSEGFSCAGGSSNHLQ